MKKNTASTNPELLSPKRKPTSPSKTETAKRQLKKAAYLEASHYILDLSKLIFGGVILANIMSLEMNTYICHRHYSRQFIDSIKLCIISKRKGVNMGFIYLCLLLIIICIAFFIFIHTPTGKKWFND